MVTTLHDEVIMSHSRAFLVCMMLASPGVAMAAGLTQHQFMADIARDLVTNADLEACLSENRNAYLMGAPFPDTGWVVFDDPLSEDAHSPAFISAFVEHIRETYPYPYAEQQRLISFMMGVASHVADDPPYHSGFIQAVAEHDFRGDYDLAHTMCDAGLEFIAIVDHDRWEDVPEYWLPLRDIEQVYARLGSSYDRWEFVLGNMILIVAEEAERWVASPLYRPLERVMPWAVANYYTYPDGGLLNGGEIAAGYYLDTWRALFASPGAARLGPLAGSGLAADDRARIHRDPAIAFARRSLEDGVVRIEVSYDSDGSVTLRGPVILDMDAWTGGVNELARAFSGAMQQGGVRGGTRTP